MSGPVLSPSFTSLLEGQLPFHKDPKLPGTNSELLSVREPDHTPWPTGKVKEGRTLWAEHTEGVHDDHSGTWDIDLENGVLPSDSSSLVTGTTVVIDTGRIWDIQERTREPLQVAMDPHNEPQLIATGSPARRSVRVASRFFPNRGVGPSLYGTVPIPRTPAPDREDHPDEELDLTTLHGSICSHSLDVEQHHTPGWETDSFSGDCHTTRISGA